MNNTMPQLRAVYLQAIDIAEPEHRCRFVDTCCSHDPELGRHVKQLLECGDEDAGFMTVSAVLQTALLMPPEQSAAETLQPGTVIERYQLLRKLGSGGMGTVFLAKQLQPVKRLVALKVLRSDMLTTGTAAQIAAESQTLADLKHPGIVSLLDAGCLPDGRPWFVMDYIAGLSLTAYCREQQLTPEERLKLIIELCNAVGHAHSRGIIHLDLKPSNVLVEQVDGRPVCRLIDFGIRRDLHAPCQPSALIGGTPDYMSPEQASGCSDQIDARSDVFSLGRILAEVVFGSPLAVASTTHTESLPLPGPRCRELRCIVRRATAEPAGDRYASAAELRDDLQRFLNRQPIIATFRSAIETPFRCQHFAKRTAAATKQLVSLTDMRKSAES